MTNLLENHSQLEKKLQQQQQMVLSEILILHRLQLLNYKTFVGYQNPIQANTAYGH